MSEFPKSALAAFRAMEKAECTCPPDRAEYAPRCPGCEGWWADHGKLTRALRLTGRVAPYVFPCVDDPANPAPEDWYQPNHRRQAQQLYRDLSDVLERAEEA